MVDRGAQSTAAEGRLPTRGLFAGLLLLALIFAAVVVRYREPAPRGEGVPPQEFSAARARAMLVEVLGPGVPHPVGSAENARLRERLMMVLTRLGYRVEEGDAVGCHPSGSCGRVRNLLAVLPGREPGGVVLLVTHYDSVAAGPGVADDLAAVAAVLEVARALRAGPAPKNGFAFLIDDGEEAGLLGAHAFMARHPLAREVDAVLNAEARGSSGPSLMFETGPGSAWLVGRFAGAAPRPMTSSLFSTIYDRMPNDTDLTVFKAAGLPGLNFGFIGNPARYHTSRDDLRHLSLGSLQHHGDNLLATARALADADLAHPRRGASVFFDLFGLVVVRWPAAWTPVLAILALVLVLLAVARLVRRGRVTAGALGWGLLALPAMVLAAGVAAWLLAFVLRGRGIYAAVWLAVPAAAAAFWLLAAAAAVAAAGLVGRRAGALGAWGAVWTLWALLGLVTAVTLPGLSFLFIVPALLAGLAGLLLPSWPALAALLPLAAAGALWFPILRFLPDALGSGILAAVGALVALAATGLAPLAAAAPRRARRVAAAALMIAGLAVALWGALRPPFAPDSPKGLNLGFHQEVDATGRTVRARLYATAQPLVRLPRPMADAAPWRKERRPLFPWSDPQQRVLEAPAAPLALPAPEVTMRQDARAGGTRRLTLHLVSPRGAPIAGLALSPAAGVSAMQVAGTPVPEHDGRMAPFGPAPGWNVCSFTGLPPGGIDVELTLAQAGPLELYVFDRSYGLPPEGQDVASRRPPAVVPIGGGDVTVLTRKVRLAPPP